MHRNLKRMSIFFLLIFIAITSAAAAAVTVTWNWGSSTPFIKYYRYQVGSEAEEGWSVVTSDVTSYTLQDADPAAEYTLYLQQSYDGIFWSDSAASTSESAISMPVYLPLLGNVDAAGGPGRSVIEAERTIRTTAGDITISATGESAVIRYPYGYDKYASAFVDVLEADYPAIMSEVTVTEAPRRLNVTYAEEITDQSVLDSYVSALESEIYARLSSGLPVPPVEGVPYVDEEAEAETGSEAVAVETEAVAVAEDPEDGIVEEPQEEELWEDDFLLPPPPTEEQVIAAAEVEERGVQEVRASLPPIRPQDDLAGWYLGVTFRYEKPLAAWKSADMVTSGFANDSLLYSRGVISSLNVGYAPSESLSLGFSVGYGIMQVKDKNTTPSLSLLPFAFDADWYFLSLGDFRLLLGASLGGIARFEGGKAANIGAQAAARLGFEYRVSKDVVLILTGGVGLFGTSTSGRDMKLELELPITLSARYHF